MKYKDQIRLAAFTGANPRTVSKWARGEDVNAALRFALEAACGLVRVIDPPIQLPYQYQDEKEDAS